MTRASLAIACLLLAASCTDGQSFEKECPSGTTRIGDTCVRDVTAGSGGAPGAAGVAGSIAGGNAGAPAGGAPACSCPPDKPFCDAKGTCVACTKAEQCPLPSSECSSAACLDGVCGATPVKAGTLTSKQNPHDCSAVVCNGDGGEALMADPTDAPLDDGNPCTNDVCDGGKASHPDKKAGEPCGSGVCNGAGTCGDCVPGAKRCLDNQPQTCSASGTWIGTAKCASPDPICSAGLCTRPSKIVAGGASACVQLADETTRCWGDNTYGQLGPKSKGGAVLRPQALDIPAWTELAMSSTHACAVSADGTLRCWGANVFGQLGDGTHTDSATPVAVAAAPALAVSATATHTCAHTNLGLQCWGRNDVGQLGLGFTSADVPTPSTVGSQPVLEAKTGSATADVPGGHTCAKTGGIGVSAIRCWGDNSRGQLGTGDYQNLSAPGPSAATATLTGQVAVGGGYSCLHDGLLGTVSCWGSNAHGELGTGVATMTVPKPKTPTLDGGVAALSTGDTFACALLNDGTTRCWGTNTFGELGAGTQGGNQPTPVPSLVKDVFYIVLGQSFGCAWLTDNRVQCWGYNAAGSLGDGTLGHRPYPADVAW